eukprot:CAMPEP_0117648152 /NCGR_PEP_ID=MMETSP0804-20121206/237_1 /TAXON_ID=1074897 /ORGANISM="Tetraselmis astigmatica, Strain CCMP880" /LENGTH=79 /DNA_ID=CAMNT_0005453705 /DNA_START=613 /DNA_END=853 /DNA_ORIENTATION=-
MTESAVIFVDEDGTLGGMDGLGDPLWQAAVVGCLHRKEVSVDALSCHWQGFLCAANECLGHWMQVHVTGDIREVVQHKL